MKEAVDNAKAELQSEIDDLLAKNSGQDDSLSKM